MATIKYVKQKKYGYDPELYPGEKNSGEIMTIQNDSYSIRELLEKFTSGVMLPSQLMRKGYVSTEFSETDFNSEVPQFIDRTDVTEYVTSINDKVKSVQSAAKAKADLTKTKDEEKKRSESSNLDESQP